MKFELPDGFEVIEGSSYIVKDTSVELPPNEVDGTCGNEDHDNELIRARFQRIVRCPSKGCSNNAIFKFERSGEEARVANEIPSGYQVWDVHPDDSGHSVYRCAPDEIEPNCGNHRFHITITEGIFSVSFRHPLESILEAPLKIRLREERGRNIGRRDWMRISPLLFALGIGFIISTLFPNLVFLSMGYSELIFKDLNFIRGGLSGVLLMAYYLLFKRLKKMVGELETEIMSKNRRYIYDSLGYAYSSFYFILSMVIVGLFSFAGDFYPSISRVEIIDDVGLLFYNLLLAPGLQLFAGYVLLLYSMTRPSLDFLMDYEKLIPRVTRLTGKIMDLSRIGIMLVFLAVMVVLIKSLFFTSWLRTPFHQELYSSGGLYDLFYLLVIPVIIILVPFFVFTYLGHRVLIGIKKAYLEMVREKLLPSQIDPVKLRDELLMVEKATQRGNAEELRYSEFILQKYSMYLESERYLMDLEDRLRKTKEWPVDVSGMTQAGVALFVSLIPFLLVQIL